MTSRIFKKYKAKLTHNKQVITIEPIEAINSDDAGDKALAIIKGEHHNIDVNKFDEIVEEIF